MTYYISDGQTQRGPFTIQQLAKLGLSLQTLVWHEGMSQWQPASSVSELAPLLSQPLPNPPAASAPFGSAAPADLDPQLQHMVDAELRPGEKLVWSARPLPRMYRRQALGMVLFGIPWTAFSVFWIFMASWMSHSKASGPALIFPLFGLPFVLIGIGMLSSPIWMQRRARRTVYLLTNQRAIIMNGKVLGGAEVQSYLPPRLTSMDRIERPDGSGDLIFEQYNQPTTRGGSITIRRGFIGIERVREVEDRILRTLLADRRIPQ